MRTMTESEAKSLYHRARLYLEAAAPGNAHEILEPLFLEALPRDHTPRAKVDLLALLVECCAVLGHAEHIDKLAPELQRLIESGVKCSPEGRVRATAALARIQIINGQFADAAARCRRITPNQLDRCSAHAVVGLFAAQMDAYVRIGDFDRAEEAVAQALERAERDNDAALEGSARTLMGNVLKMKGKFPEALRLFNVAAGLHERGGDYAGVARDHLNRGTLLNRMGLLSESRRAFEEAYRRSRTAGHAQLALRSSLGLGMVEVRLGKFEHARRHLLAAWRESRRQGQRRDECLALEFLGETLTLMKRLPQARRALALCRRMADRLAPEGDLAAECSIREALLALVEGNWDLAATRARAAVDLAARRGMPWEEAQGRRLLGAALAIGGDRQAAREALEVSLQLLDRMGERLEIRLVRAWLNYLDGPAALGAADAIRASDPAHSEPTSLEIPPLHPSALPPAPVTEAEPASETADSEPVRSKEEALEDPTVDTVPPWGTPEDKGKNTRATEPDAEPDTESDSIWPRLGLRTRSKRLLSVLAEARDLAMSGANILILGETGTGKELLARGIHELSGRRGQFVPINCGGSSAELFGSELFGSERGAYTGAHRRRPGLVLQAEGGTLFLDEVGDLEPKAQMALLRFLDSGEVRALGSNKIRTVRVGVVAATHHPLQERITQQRFRSDLYYRLAQGSLSLPPLRERLEDLSFLLDRLWRRQTGGEPPPTGLLRAEVLKVLCGATWPGNVRELDHFVRRVRLLTGRQGDGLVLRAGEVRRLLFMGPAEAADEKALLPSFEEIMSALEATKGRRTKAAELLGITRSRFYRILKGYQLPSSR